MDKLLTSISVRVESKSDSNVDEKHQDRDDHASITGQRLIDLDTNKKIYIKQVIVLGEPGTGTEGKLRHSLTGSH